MLSITARCGAEWVDKMDPHELCEWLPKKDVLLWIDIEKGSEEELTLLEEQFGFHHLAIEDVRNSHQRPKIDFYDNYAFVVFYAVSHDQSENVMNVHEVELFVGPNYVLTFHDDPIQELQETHRRWEQNIAHIGERIGILLYSILDAILDGYFPLLDWIAERLDELEELIFRGPDPKLMRVLLGLKHHLLQLRRVVGPHRDVVNMLLRGEHGILPEEALPYLQDLYDHSLRIVEGVDMYREMTTTVADGFLSVQSNRINEVMQRLTIINLLFLPLAVLTGFFGMNFEMLPFDSPIVMGIALLAMILLPASLYFWLRRQGWVGEK